MGPQRDQDPRVEKRLLQGVSVTPLPERINLEEIAHPDAGGTIPLALELGLAKRGKERKCVKLRKKYKDTGVVWARVPEQVASSEDKTRYEQMCYGGEKQEKARTWEIKVLSTEGDAR